MASIPIVNIDDLINNRTLIVISGPTASGKTGVSIELSKLMNIEVISADSRQIYKYMDIGTATPSPEELDAVDTHFINILEPDEYFSAGLFASQAREQVEKIYSKSKLPVVVGGSGLYIKALCEGLFDDTKIDKGILKIRDELNDRLKSEGIVPLYEELKLLDLKSAELYSDMNPRRIIRALEYYLDTGIPFSTAHQKFESKSDFNVLYFAMDFERNILYDRINKRSELMWEKGLVEETKNILDKGYSPILNSLNTVGYKEAIAYINDVISKDEAIEKMKQNTRRYAKRQMTWFRKVPNVIWLSGSKRDIAGKIYASLGEQLDRL